MEPHAAQREVLESKAQVRFVQWGRRAGKTVLCQMALDQKYSKYPHPIVVDDAEDLQDPEVDALRELAIKGERRLLIVGTPREDHSWMRLAECPGAVKFQGPSWINPYL